MSYKIGGFMKNVAHSLHLSHCLNQTPFTMKNFLFFLTLMAMTTLMACSSDKGNQQAAGDDTESSTSNDSNADNGSNDGSPASIQDAMQQAKDAMKQLNDGKEVEVVNFRDLQELMPEKLNGYERTKKGGQTAGAMGMNVSTAEATYEKGDQKIEMAIIDTGGLGMAMMGMAAWATATVDREDENGYERTVLLDGNKCFEKYRKNGGTSEINVIVADRFIAKAEGRIHNEGQMDDLRDMLKEVGLGKISKIK